MPLISQTNKLLAGVVITILLTPATIAGIVSISTEEGYNAFPPGTYRPQDSKGDQIT